ncbi:MAG: retroviral-like aspartic protease family protein [Treponema sp.]|nr:retroviral-like aspartic protease family protein [Treponema sp.]
MSAVYTEITLRNIADEAIAETGLVKNHKIRQTTVKALVDTNAWTLVINEATRQQLGLRKRQIETKTGTLANGKITEYSIAGPVEVKWKNRRATCDAIVLPKADNILLGKIPLDAMDLIIHPQKEEVVGAHGDEELHKIK